MPRSFCQAYGMALKNEIFLFCGNDFFSQFCFNIQSRTAAAREQ